MLCRWGWNNNKKKAPQHSFLKKLPDNQKIIVQYLDLIQTPKFGKMNIRVKGRQMDRGEKLLLGPLWSLQCVRRYRGPMDHIKQKVISGFFLTPWNTPYMTEARKQNWCHFSFRDQQRKDTISLAELFFVPKLSLSHIGRHKKCILYDSLSLTSSFI